MAIVRYKREPGDPLTRRQKENLKRIAEIKDEDIDFSDIPELTDEWFARAVRGKFYRPAKEIVSIIALLGVDGAGECALHVAAIRRRTGTGSQPIVPPASKNLRYRSVRDALDVFGALVFNILFFPEFTRPTPRP